MREGGLKDVRASEERVKGWREGRKKWESGKGRVGDRGRNSKEKEKSSGRCVD